MITDDLKKWDKKVTETLTEMNLLRRQVKTLHQDQELLLIKSENLEETRVIFQKSAQITQGQISLKIEKIVSSALYAVLDEPYEFKVNFVTRRNTSECDLRFVDDEGNEFEPLDSCGYGAADIASLALRVAYWSMSKEVMPTRDTIIFDEPLRNLSLNKQPLASKMIKQLSESLGIQFLVVTHNLATVEYADRIFKVTKKNKVSRIKQIN